MASYKDFNEYYNMRIEILGLQDAANENVPLFRVIRKYLSGCDSILDVGTGRGMFLVPLARLGKDISGLDYCGGNVELLTSHGYQAHECDCVADIPYHQDFDAAICAEVLEHLSADEGKALLKNISQTLKPDGRLIITVPYKEKFEVNMVFCPHCHQRYHRHGHVRNYQEAAELISDLEGQGYRYLMHELIYSVSLFKNAPLVVHKLIGHLRPNRPANLVALFVKK
jgi:2-polyprenyl-3-methyl-5-hydroxy-6-metoxy-1,4-benzoquinol methylase